MGLFSWLSGGKGKAEPKAQAAPEAGVGDDRDGDAGGTSASTAALSEELSARDGGLRVDAARALLERWRGGDGEAAQSLAPRLSELLQDPEPLVRMAALSATRMLRKPENQEKVAPHVLALLADPAAQVRTAAVWAAARLPGEVPRTQVRALLASEEEPMRFAAACALADRQDAASLPELTAALAEDVRRQEALSSILALGDPAALPQVAALFDDERLGEFDRTLVAAVLARFGDQRGQEHLIARIEGDGDDRPIAAEWAGRLGLQAAAEALRALAEEEDAAGRGAALRALGRLKAPGAAERLLALAGDKDQAEDLRMDAAEGLAELGTPEAKALLRGLAASGGGELQPLCGELLIELAAAEANAALEQQDAGGSSAPMG